MDEEYQIDPLNGLPYVYISHEQMRRSIAFTNKGFVYAIVVGEKIKVGKTKNPDKRIKSYRPIADNFRVIGVWESDNYHELERDLLKQLGGKPYVIEWFAYTQEAEEKVRTYMATEVFESFLQNNQN